MKRAVQFLKSFEAFIDDLSEISEVDGEITATIDDVCVSIPEDIATKFRPNIGSRVGLLKTDSGFRLKIWVESMPSENRNEAVRDGR